MNPKPYILMISLLCGLLPGMALAGDHEQQNGLTLDEAVSEVREQTGGRILSAKTVNHEGMRVHQIRVLTGDGRVRRIQMKAHFEKRKSPPGRQNQ